MSGCLKLLFSRARDRVEAILINSAGGLTSGDQLTLRATAYEGARLSLTTQAAERAYRANAGAATVQTVLTAAPDATLFWLPQELILFNGARLTRQLRCDLANSARALLVEPIIFGRHAMGEVLNDIDIRDEISITRNGRPLFKDRVHLCGDMRRHLRRPVIAAGSGAMVTLAYVAPDAEARGAQLRDMLPRLAGASCVAEDVLIIRAMAAGSLELRRFLIPLLDILTQDSLPVCWRL